MAQDWEFSKHYYHLEKERKKKEIVTTRGIRIWSPIRVEIPLKEGVSNK